ncbi:MAG: hypothetical protein IKG42_03950 [Clostridia bacterium]|nr:hypothetical protein [Clostridia bacterium]
MEEEKKTEDVKKKKRIKLYVIIIIFMVIIIALIGVQIYSTSNGYGGIVGLVKGEKKEEETKKQNDVVVDEKESNTILGVYKVAEVNGVAKSEIIEYLVIEDDSIFFTDDLSSKLLEGTYTINSKNEIDYRLLKDTQDYAFYTASTYEYEEDKNQIVVSNGTEKVYYKKTTEKMITNSQESNNQDSNNTNSNNNNNQVSNSVTTLDVSSNFVQGLYNKVVHSDRSEPCYAWEQGVSGVSFYKDNKTTYSSLNNITKVLDVLQNAGVPRKITDENEKNNIINNSSLKNSGVYITDIEVYEDIKSVANRVFEDPNDIKWETYTGLATQLEYINGNYYAIHFQGGGRGTVEYAYSTITKAEQDGDYIYIYDKFIWVDETDEKNIKVYTTSDETNQIGTESFHSDAGNRLLYQYDSSLHTFKHTFKKSSDGTYKWISTEINN